MKNILFIITTALLLASCGGDTKSVDDLIEGGDLSAIKERKAELNAQQNELKVEIEKLNTFIHM